MRYTHKNVAEGGERADPAAKPAKIVIKTKNAQSGIVYKFKVRKANELSRILASLGPQYFEFENERKRGAAAIMGDVELAEPARETTQPATAEQPAQAQPPKEEEARPAPSKSKKKKKSKK